MEHNLDNYAENSIIYHQWMNITGMVSRRDGWTHHHPHQDTDLDTIRAEQLLSNNIIIIIIMR